MESSEFVIYDYRLQHCDKVNTLLVQKCVQRHSQKTLCTSILRMWSHHRHPCPRRTLCFHWLLLGHVTHHMTPARSHSPTVSPQSWPEAYKDIFPAKIYFNFESLANNRCNHRIVPNKHSIVSCPDLCYVIVIAVSKAAVGATAKGHQDAAVSETGHEVVSTRHLLYGDRRLTLQVSWNEDWGTTVHGAGNKTVNSDCRSLEKGGEFKQA